MSNNLPIPYDHNLTSVQENCEFSIPLGTSVCKINIAGYSLDNFKTFDPTAYTVLCRLGQTCDGLNYFPATSKIVLNVGQQSQITSNLQNLLPNISKDLMISEEDTIQTLANFFSDKKIVVQPVGIQGKVYHFMRSVQTYIPISYMNQAVGTMKITGLTGVKIITQAPLTFVGATFIGAIFFSYCGGIAGNNTVGLVFNATSFALSRPMRGVEIVVNGLALKPLSNLVGMPFMLNGTQEILYGTGLSVKEYGKVAIAFERLMNSKVVKKIKKIYDLIRDKN